MMISSVKMLSSLFLCLHLIVWLPSLCFAQQSSPNECNLEEQFLRSCTCRPASGTTCGPSAQVTNPSSHARLIECRPPQRTLLESFPVSIVDRNENISCLVIYSAGFTSLTRRDIAQFPNLQGLHIINAPKLETVDEDLFDDTTKRLELLSLAGSRIRKLPRLTGLSCLKEIDIHNNEIDELRAGDFDGINRLITFLGSGNNIRELRGTVFTGHCFLTTLDLKDNPIEDIDNVALENTSIVNLDLSRTNIKTVPVTQSLRRWLEKLLLEGTRMLKTFDPFSPPPGASYNQTFPLLRNVSFQYHALCCRMRYHHYLQLRNLRRMRYIHSNTANDVLSEVVSRKSFVPGHSRQVRQAPSTSVSHRCVNVTSRQCVDDVSSDVENVTVTAEEFCNLTDVCFPCLNDVCQSGSCDPNNTTVESGSGVGEMGLTAFPSEIICISLMTPEPTPTKTVVSSTITRVNRTICSSASVVPTPTPTPVMTNPCDNPEFDYVCSENGMSFCNGCFSGTDANNCLECIGSPEFACTGAIQCDRYHARACECQFKRRRKRDFSELIHQTRRLKKRNAMTSPSLGTSEICSTMEIEALCVTTVTVPLATPTMTPRPSSVTTITTIVSNDTDETAWFYLNQSNTGFRCRELINNETESPTVLTTTTEGVGDPVIGEDPLCMAECSIKTPLRLETAVLSDHPTACFPVPNELNPCDDLLEDHHALRSVIWIVIILALFGNALVIVVFLGYSVIVRRTHQDLFVYHFFYFNLALADSLMGIYLLSIAIEDAATLNNFSAHDIFWRTGHGCGFAGFCAILSVIVSVYVLVVISLERAYTIVRVMHRRKVTKPIAMIIMAVGWIIGAIIAMLPLVGVSDYGFVAICLPFDVSTPINQGYVVFLLLITGIGFITVAVCYTIIFYQVFCSRKKHVRRQTSKAWSQEVKAAFRMGLLVTTNFVCWIPIASVGIGSAFGYDLKVNLTFAKWVMVFIFPINSCLNPFLYSFTTKVFRENFVILMSKCGLCQHKAIQIRNARIGITPSITSNRDSTSRIPSQRRRSTIIERLRLLSWSAQGSSSGLFDRRSSGGSLVVDDNSQHLRQKRRSSEFSSGSGDLLMGNTSRRESTFSGSSLEENMTFGNPGYRANSPIDNNTSSEVTVVIEPSKSSSQGNHRQKISATTLGVVPEEGEIVPAAEDTLKLNNGYKDNDEDETDAPSATTEVVPRQNGVAPHVFAQHQIDATKNGTNNSSKRDSGNSGSYSDSVSINDGLSEIDSESCNTPPQLPTSSNVQDDETVERTFIDDAEVEALPTSSKREVQSQVIEFD